jgi:hypothetical protein
MKRREDKEMKDKQEAQEKRSQEDISDDLEFIHPTFQPKPKNLLEAIFAKCLTLLNKLENHINL